MESLRAEEKWGVLWDFMDTSGPSNQSPPKLVNNTLLVLTASVATNATPFKYYHAARYSYKRFAVVNEHASVYSYDRNASLGIPVCKCIKPYEYIHRNPYISSNLRHRSLCLRDGAAGRKSSSRSLTAY